MSNLPLISIVSASWNQGKYLQECIDSLQIENNDCIEHIVIDNCSDDETAKILEDNPHIIKVIEPDEGQSNALNKGFRKARGKWILWLNVDDFLCPGTMEAFLEAIEMAGDSFDMLYGHMVFVDGESNKIKTVYHPRWKYWMTFVGGYVAPSTGSLFRRSLLLSEPLDESYHMIMDSEWMLRAGRKLRARRLNREVVAFRVADNKTAEHINSGVLTPVHQSERIKLSQAFPTYGFRNESGKGRVFHSWLWVVRKLLRAWVLVDKAICKFGPNRKNAL